MTENSTSQYRTIYIKPTVYGTCCSICGKKDPEDANVFLDSGYICNECYRRLKGLLYGGDGDA